MLCYVWYLPILPVVCCGYHIHSDRCVLSCNTIGLPLLYFQPVVWCCGYRIRSNISPSGYCVVAQFGVPFLPINCDTVTIVKSHLALL